MRGLKRLIVGQDMHQWEVAPHVGAWIETRFPTRLRKQVIVAPHVGAWIETDKNSLTWNAVRVAPHVGAWIET